VKYGGYAFFVHCLYCFVGDSGKHAEEDLQGFSGGLFHAKVDLLGNGNPAECSYVSSLKILIPYLLESTGKRIEKWEQWSRSCTAKLMRAGRIVLMWNPPGP
jgi:hypothetical protein